ncbi:MAG: hypothetical protein GEU95_19245 [Rhizobiales bacterium]|nr:hypothetical protein [Hyphomicrobiales bacterium]
MQRILIAGGYGIVGTAIARHLRRLSQDSEIVLAGRNPDNGAALARELGHASTMYLDAAALDGGAIDLQGVDLVISALYDPANALIDAAIAQGAAHIGITTKADDVAPGAALALASPPKRPVVLLGHCCAGAVGAVARSAAEDFSKVDSIAIAALFDPRDAVGPMTAADPEALISRALIRQHGVWSWANGMEHPRTVRLSDAEELPAFPTGLLDAPGLAAVTGAANIRLDLMQGDSLGTREGGRASSDAYIDIEGTLKSGSAAKRRVVMSDPNGVANLTALGVLLAAERVLGLDGEAPAAGGLSMPETLLAADQATTRLKQWGVRVIAA